MVFCNKLCFVTFKIFLLTALKSVVAMNVFLLRDNDFVIIAKSMCTHIFMFTVFKSCLAMARYFLINELI